MVEAVDEVRAAVVEDAGETAVHGKLRALHVAGGGVHVDRRCKEDARREQTPPERDLGVLLDAHGVGTRHHEVHESLLRPCGHVHAEIECVLDARWNADADSDDVAPLRLGCGGKSPDIAHEARENGRSGFVGAGREGGDGAEPVEFESVAVEVEQIFADEVEVVVVDLALPVVEGVVVPVPLLEPGAAVPRARKALLVEVPEVGVLRAFLEAGARPVDIVHAHRVPVLDATGVAVVAADAHVVGAVALHLLKRAEHAGVCPLVVDDLPAGRDHALSAQPERAVVAEFNILRVRRPRAGVEERPLEVHVEDHGGDASAGDIEVYVVLESLFGHPPEVIRVPETPSVKIDESAFVQFG